MRSGWRHRWSKTGLSARTRSTRLSNASAKSLVCRIPKGASIPIARQYCAWGAWLAQGRTHRPAAQAQPCPVACARARTRGVRLCQRAVDRGQSARAHRRPERGALPRGPRLAQFCASWVGPASSLYTNVSEAANATLHPIQRDDKLHLRHRWKGGTTNDTVSLRVPSLPKQARIIESPRSSMRFPRT